MEVKLYMAVILLSLLGIVASYFVPYKFESMQDSNWMDLLKNISFGCFTSTLVSAWIEKANIKGSNDKNNKMYHEIYLDLQFSIRSYVESWSRIYYVIFREEDVKTEVTVPNVVGMTIKDAKKALEEVGLGLDYEETEEDVSEKVVTKQTPVNGIKIYEGTNVILEYE